MDIAAKTKHIETEAELRVQEWRKTRVDTAGLKEYSRGMMQHESFNSAVSSRLNTEVSIHERNCAEADASFYAYMETQKLASHTVNSGAQAWPDAQPACSRLVGAMSTFSEKQGTPRLGAAVRDSQARVEESQTAFQPADAALFAASLGRIAVRRAVEAATDGDFERAVSDAHAHFASVGEQALGADDAASYAKASSFASTRDVVEAFPAASATVRSRPYDVRYVSSFAQVSSADGQPEPASRLTHMSFAALAHGVVPRPRSSLDRVASLELKKTQIALLAQVRGTEDVITELVPFIELVADSFETPAAASAAALAPTASPAALARNGAANGHRLFSSHRHDNASTRSSAASARSSNPVASSATQPSTSQPGASQPGASQQQQQQRRQSRDTDARIVAESWSWIGQQYAKFGFDQDAKGASREAETVFPRSGELGAYAQTHCSLGSLEAAAGAPGAASSQYRKASQAAPDSVAAAVGAAQISADDAFESQGLDRELALAVSSALETACQRSPARFAAEAWHARGMLAQKLGDDKDARDVFWRAVELEERCGVTPYVFSI